MGSSLRCRYWSLLQVVAIVVCCRGEVSSEVAQNGVGEQLNLRCPDMKVIAITTVVLGDSNCIVSLLCCITTNDCTHNPNESHRTDVLLKCNSKPNCTIDVFSEGIPCGLLCSMSYNYYERITYDCIDDPRNETTNWTNKVSSVTDHTTDSGSTVNRNAEQTTKQDLSSIVTSAGIAFTLYNNTKAGDQVNTGPATQGSSSQVIPIVVGIIGLIILLAVVALVVAVVVLQRKKSALRKLSPDNHQHETDVHENEIQGTSEHKSNYAMIQKVDEVDEADFPKTEQYPVVYSEVEQRTTVWSQGQSLAADPGTQLMSDEGQSVIENDLYSHCSEGEGQATDKTRTSNQNQTGESDAYEKVGEPSKSVSSVFKKDQIGSKGAVNMENRVSNNIYELKSHDMEDIYVSESAADPGTHLVADDFSKISMPQDDDGQTVIENDLYSH